MSQGSYLTKSDFKVARSCPTKLYYRKLGYSTTKDENPYFELLADGGYMIEVIAQLLFPDGRPLGYAQSDEEAFRETLAALQAERVTLFEATFISNHKLARIDILVRDGRRFDLIEIKAKAFSERRNRERLAEGKPNLFHSTRRGHGIMPAWRPYLEDVTFQVAVLQELYPQAEIVPYLCMPDADKSTSIDGLHRCFSLRRVERPGMLTEIEVEFTGDAEALRRDHFLAFVNVQEEVDALLPLVREQTSYFVGSLKPTLQKLEKPLSLHCRDCEFRLGDGTQQDGFSECWGEMAQVRPNLFDLYQVGVLGPRNDKLANRLIQQGRFSLFDVQTEDLVRRDGSVGVYNQRQRIQLDHTRRNVEWISEELGELIRSFRYPLHFIDFETSTLAVPYHAVMCPYETVAFQWSCHTLHAPDAEPVHSEWINVEDSFPNFAFADSLRHCIGDGGTVFMWATHENSTLRTILEQLAAQKIERPELREWLHAIVRQTANGEGSDGRLVDMNALTLAHYFHPRMGGRTSIKVVSDAIWQTDATIRARLPQYVREEDGRLLSPYKTLPPIEIDGQPMAVAEGTGAIRAYQAMMYGLERDDEETKRKWQQLLLQYCKLDTLAMVMVWWRWCGLTGLTGSTQKN